MDLGYWFGNLQVPEGRTQPRLTDHFILLRRSSGLVAVWANAVEGVTRHMGSELVRSPAIHQSEAVGSARWQFLKTPEGLVPICDVELLLQTAPTDLQSSLVSEKEGAES
jgi:chemotaxis signal transduction protein